MIHVVLYGGASVIVIFAAAPAGTALALFISGLIALAT